MPNFFSMSSGGKSGKVPFNVNSKTSTQTLMSMSLKNLFALSLTTLACAALVGCASTRHPNGVPKRLDDASEASRFAYFMGLQVEDQRAPEGFDPEKSSQLATDVAVSATAHGLNALTGARDIGSFGVEFGLSLGKAIFSVPPEAKYSQVMMFLPGADYSNASDAAIAAVETVQAKIKESAKAIGVDVFGGGVYHANGIRFASVRVADSKLGCQKTEDQDKLCYFSVYAQERKFPKKAEPAAQWLIPNSTEPYWQICHMRIEANGPETAKLSEALPELLARLSSNLPPNTWLYVAPMKIDEKWTLPYVSDGKKVHFFIEPK